MKVKTITFSKEGSAMRFFSRLTAKGYGVSASGSENKPWRVSFFRPAI